MLAFYIIIYLLFKSGTIYYLLGFTLEAKLSHFSLIYEISLSWNNVGRFW